MSVCESDREKKETGSTVAIHVILSCLRVAPVDGLPVPVIHVTSEKRKEKDPSLSRT